MEPNSEDAMQSEPFLKCSCHHCGGHIEFPPDGLGQSISCPHCGEETKLEQNFEARNATTRRKRPVLIIALGSLALMCAMAAGIFLATKRSESPSPHRVEPVAPKIIEPNDSSASPAKRRKKNAKPVKVISINSVDWNGLKSGEVAIENSGGRLIYAVGTVRNESERQRFGITVDLDLLDAAGKKIGAATDYTQVIEPKKEWRFKALVTDPKTARAEITRIKEN